jgi:hypothetical protein
MMMNKEKIFVKRTSSSPKIYAYIDLNPQYNGLLKVGYTTIDVKTRVAQQYPTSRPGELPYKIVLEESAMRNDGSSFTDKDVHAVLRKMGVPNPDRTEWFKTNFNEVLTAINTVKNRTFYDLGRTNSFPLRPEQEEAIVKTIDYIYSYKKDNNNKTPHFLWNAKMRFGKTFTAYQLAKKMNWKKILILTFKPAVISAWEEDLLSHVDFDGWQFYKRNGIPFEDLDFKKTLVCFGSFQDFLGKTSAGGIKPKNEWVHTTNWDCVILDEYHYGAWRDNAKDLFEAEDTKEQEYGLGEGIDYFDEDIMPITTGMYLYLSGTPFRAIASGEFIEEQIYNWTYTDEQKAKESWSGPSNPYLSLPKMVLMTYQLPESIKQIASKGEFNEFDLNVFFSTKGLEDNAKFIYEEEVQLWLNLIRGAHLETSLDNLKQGSKKPPLPFKDSILLETLTHTFWFLPSVSSTYAMQNLLLKKNNKFYHDYKIIVAAGKKAGIGVEALYPVREAMEDPLKSKTITLSCGKLTTGVTVPPWSGIFMLRNSSSPETYFQAAFRVQSPWVIKNQSGITPNKEDLIKEVCYVFDFAPNRALRQIQEYSFKLSVESISPEEKVANFINFLPVLAYDGSSMKRVNASEILDIAMSGTTATLLAKRWESALLVNVDNETLKKLMNNADAMKALENIEGFRSLNSDIQTIINNSESIKKAKRDSVKKEPNSDKRKELSEAEKEQKSLRKKIQEKLIKFATRIPVFMYLTDFREHTLKDVISKLEPNLFYKVTGLTIKDFDLLVSLGVFNSSLMNDAVYKFKRYEDSSLVYTGIDRHEGEKIGLYDTVISKEEFTTN